MMPKMDIVEFTDIINHWRKGKMSESINLERREESITLNKGMAGKIGWEIKLYRKETETYDEMVNRLKIINDELTETFYTTTKLEDKKHE